MKFSKSQHSYQFIYESLFLALAVLNYFFGNQNFKFNKQILIIAGISKLVDFFDNYLSRV